MTPTARSNAPFERLRFEIGKSWSVQDFTTLFGDLDKLYEIALATSASPKTLASRGSLSQAALQRRESLWMAPALAPGLQVVRIRYESPGFADLVGIGRAVKEVRLFVEKLIDLRATRRKEGLENEQRAAEVRAEEIENARRMVQLHADAKAAGIDGEVLQPLLDQVEEVQARLGRLVDRGKLKAVKNAPPGKRKADSRRVRPKPVTE